jgi:tight adherence protein C
VTAMVALGAAWGASVFVLVWALARPRTSIPDQLARFDARPTTRADSSARQLGPGAQVRARLGAVLASGLARHGISYRSLRQDLTLTGRTFEDVLVAKLAAFATGFFLAVAAAVGLHVGAGISVPIASPAVLAVAAGAGLSFVPDLHAHRLAAQRRRQFRRALGSWLDLVALEMAGSAAPAEALPTAARVSTQWPMVVLGDTLYRATAAGQDHWEALTDLGHRIGIPELIDLATLARLVGRDGARVRDTLTARAASMRRAQLAEAQSQAGRQDQSMLVAQILIGFGFIVFLMFPALANVMAV